MARPRAMIVTAGVHQAPLILKARELGYEILATDSNSSAPSLSLADHIAVVDATNFLELLRVARNFRPEAILTEQTDVAVPAVAFVADTLGLPGIGYRTAVQATDKWEMRKICRQTGIPTPPFRLVESVEEAFAAVDEIGLPVVVKPVDNQASRGVTKVEETGGIEEAANRALAGSPTGRALVEQQMFGAECSVETFVSGDIISVLGVSEKTKSRPPFSFDLQLIYPGSFSTDQFRALSDFNSKVIRALGVRMGFVHAELIITADGVRLIEVAARGCGARVTTDLLPRLTGTDLLAARLLQASGHDIKIAPTQQDLVGILRFFEFEAGMVQRINGLEEAASLDGVIHLEFSPTIGTVLTEPHSGDQRPGFVLATAASREEAIKLANEVMTTVTVDIDSDDAVTGPR
jgi:biotin carboxylase